MEWAYTMRIANFYSYTYTDSNMLVGEELMMNKHFKINILIKILIGNQVSNNIMMKYIFFFWKS